MTAESVSPPRVKEPARGVHFQRKQRPVPAPHTASCKNVAHQPGLSRPKILFTLSRGRRHLSGGSGARLAVSTFALPSGRAGSRAGRARRGTGVVGTARRNRIGALGIWVLPRGSGFRTGRLSCRAVSRLAQLACRCGRLRIASSRSTFRAWPRRRVAVLGGLFTDLGRCGRKYIVVQNNWTAMMCGAAMRRADPQSPPALCTKPGTNVAGDHASGVCGEMETAGQYRNVELVVARGAMPPRGGHHPAVRAAAGRPANRGSSSSAVSRRIER